MSTSPASRRRGAVDVLRPVIVLLLVMWALEVVDAILPVALDAWGIQGRTASGLVGIVVAPVLHGGFAHLIANTLPFLVLGGLVAWRSADRFPVVLGISEGVTEGRHAHVLSVRSTVVPTVNTPHVTFGGELDIHSVHLLDYEEVTGVAFPIL